MATKKRNIKTGLKNTSESGFTGSTVKKLRMASGVKLSFDEEGQHAILKFQITTDISDKVADLGADKKALYHKFVDGKKLVNLAENYAMSEVDFEIGKYYYFENKGKVQIKGGSLNDMNDIHIEELGNEGDKVGCPIIVNATGQIILTESNIGLANYGEMNYPLKDDK